MDVNRTYNGSSWTIDENKRFEFAVAIYPDDCDERWEKIATMVPGKSIEEIKQHYKLLEEDVEAIESGLIPLPEYKCSSTDSMQIDQPGQMQMDSFQVGREEQSTKGMPWTDEEHWLFLAGMQRYGRGDWRNISRKFVVSRTPVQVASHAQKYFIRLNKSSTGKKRPSINDITTTDQAYGSIPLEPITGKRRRTDIGGSSSRSWNEPPPMGAQELNTIVPPCMVQSFDCPTIPAPAPPPPDYSFPGEMVNGFDALNPASLIPSDQMNLAWMDDFLEPGFFDRMF